jgi:peptidyl-prolyl cis-trans isomerase A (cyclophilin A)
MKKETISIVIFTLIIFVGLSGCQELPKEIFDEMTIVKFTVEPSLINLGETANLSWVVNGSNTVVSIDNEIGNVSLIGYRIIIPNETITYTLTAENQTSKLTATAHIIVKYNDGIDENDTDDIVENPIAVFDTTMGNFKIELFEDKLPITAGNFIQLVNDEFYNGMTFYRISDNFMIQAGRYFPDGSEKQSPYGRIEFETHDDVKHVDGAISMASTGAGVGGSAEFFICDGKQSFLDGNYAPFGVVIEGIEVVRNIAAQPHDNSNPAGGGVPLQDIIINSIIIE